jgi:thiol-disulfide isomerase/thioredoxin/uncharacterized membrane protein YphA (DoxX/SURF4 family)
LIEGNLKKYIAWGIRILIAALFLVSAFAKIYPDPSMFFSISKFEFTQLYPLGFGRELSALLSRFLIGVEFSLGFLILFPFNLKKVVIPATILMLAFFCVHLTIEIATGGNKGNCGCFGSLLPMTPLQALLKNILAIVLLFVLNWKFSNELSYKSNFVVVFSFVIACILGMFLMIPIKSQTKTPKEIPTIQEPIEVSVVSKDTVKKENPEKIQAVKDTTLKVHYEGPKKKKSGFAKIFPKIDEGRKILCFFAPTCDHCMATAKELTEMKKSDPNFPEINIIFMDEGPEEIPAFFKFAGSEYPNYVMDIIEFWQSIGNGHETPGVVYLWNGNVQKFYSGIDKDKFNKEELKKILRKEF